MKLIVSVSRDVLESVEASQICICNVNEDTIGWSGGSIIARDSCFGLLANCWWVRRVHWNLWQLAIPTWESSCIIQNPKT